MKIPAHSFLLKKIIRGTVTFTLVLGFYACNKPEDITPQDTAPYEAASGVLSNAEYMDNSYIVVFRPDRIPLQANVSESFNERRVKALGISQTIFKEKEIPVQALYSVYGFALSGFAAKLTPEQVITLGKDPRVAYIEKDQVVRLIPPNQLSLLTGLQVSLLLKRFLLESLG